MKTRALTEMVYIDEVEVDQEGIAEMMLDESSIAQVARKFELLCLNVEKLCSLDKTWLSFRTWNITETSWNKSGRRSHTSCKVMFTRQCLFTACHDDVFKKGRNA